LARAKRTDRAEARRRHRAATAEADGTAGAEVAATSVAAPKGTNTKPAMSSPAGRISMGTAFRQSFHPVDVRADLAALPWLVTHTYALWVPIAITVVGGIAVALANDPSQITSLLYEYFVRPPAIGGVFIAGFLAPRASWLLGLIVGLVSALVNALLVTFVPLAIFATAPDPAQTQEFIVTGFLLSPIFGALFASGAAWYRRFLQLSNPNRGKRAEVKKGTDGKSRTTGKDQKAGARR
jgi:hypothetical protein